MIKNQIKTFVFFALLTFLLLWIGSFWGKEGLIIALVFVFIINFGSYWYSDKIVLSMYRAKKISKKDMPRIHEIVEGVSEKAKIPKPEIYIIPTKNANAFATGRAPKHSAIAFTKGILNLLDENELKGVVSHEISHIKNRDTLIQTVVATVVGAISYIAVFARWGLLFNDKDDNILEILVFLILAPIIATILQLSISRSREFLADESGAKILGNGDSLASALEKLELKNKSHPLEFGNKATSCLFISNPFNKGLLNLFSTHPPIEERIKRLRNFK